MAAVLVSACWNPLPTLDCAARGDCWAGEACIDGTCVETPSCGADQEPCGAACVDTRADADHCGACGSVCGGICIDGDCFEPRTIAAGISHTCAADADAVWCWGGNDASQLGAHPKELSSVPVQVGARGALRLESGGDHTCSLMDDTTLRCWGRNGNSQADWETPDAELPYPTTLTGGYADVSVGYLHTCAIDVDSRLACWGANTAGQSSADGTPTASSGRWPTPDTASSVAAGALHSCAIFDELDPPAVYCWGEVDDADGPAWVSGTDGVESIEVGAEIGCAGMPGAPPHCWTLRTLQPVDLADVELEAGDVIRLSATRDFGCRVRAGLVTCFGDGPVIGAVELPALAADLAVGGAHACAVTDAGMYCWGDDTSGQLGSRGEARGPVRVEWAP